MRKIATLCVLFITPFTATATPLSCAENTATFQLMCFAKNGVRSNGLVRAAKLWRGGPKNIDETSFTARVHCGSGALELTDRDGVAFARNIPEAQVGKDFVRYLCAHSPTKPDKKLKTN